MDQITVKKHDPTWWRYAMPGGCNGVYYATLDDVPVYQGQRDSEGHWDGWLYEEV